MIDTEARGVASDTGGEVAVPLRALFPFWFNSDESVNESELIGGVFLLGAKKLRDGTDIVGDDIRGKRLGSARPSTQPLSASLFCILSTNTRSIAPMSRSPDSDLSEASSSPMGWRASMPRKILRCTTPNHQSSATCRLLFLGRFCDASFPRLPGEEEAEECAERRLRGAWPADGKCLLGQGTQVPSIISTSMSLSKGVIGNGTTLLTSGRSSSEPFTFEPQNRSPEMVCEQAAESEMETVGGAL